MQAQLVDLIAKAQILSIRLVALTCRSRSADVPENAQLTSAYEAHVGGYLKDGTFSVHTSLKVTGGNAEFPEFVLIEATYELVYRVPPDVQPNPEVLDEFAKKNGVFNAWPFLRELVSTASLRLGVPQIVLPLHRPNLMPKPAPQLPVRRRKPIEKKTEKSK